MPVSGEEKGLLGSKYYVTYPLYDLKDAVANVNIDMVGRVDDIYQDSVGMEHIYVITKMNIFREMPGNPISHHPGLRKGLMPMVVAQVPTNA